MSLLWIECSVFFFFFLNSVRNSSSPHLVGFCLGTRPAEWLPKTGTVSVRSWVYLPYVESKSRITVFWAVHVVATFPGTVLFPLLCSLLPFFSPKYIDSFLHLVLLFHVSVSKISSLLHLNVGPLFSSVPKLHLKISMLL